MPLCGNERVKVSYVCAEVTLSEPTFYNWKGRYLGMTASEMKRLREIEEENTRLKRMYANLSLDHQILKDGFKKKWQAHAKSGNCETYSAAISRSLLCPCLSAQRFIKERKKPYFKDGGKRYLTRPQWGYFRKILRYISRPWRHERLF